MVSPQESADLKIVERASYSDKWIEFWFKGYDTRTYNQCCKSYTFWDLIKSRNLDEYCLNHGVVGLRLKWESGEDPTEVFKPHVEYY